MAFLTKALVDFIQENHGVPHLKAKRSVDADYAKGYVMYLVAEDETTCETTNVVTKHPKLQLRVFDSKDAITYWTTDIARDILLLQDFKWDDTLAQANEIGTERA